jgi:DNA-binding PadR family transcriptional regulator
MKPLDPAQFFVLLALSDQPMHGYAIVNQIRVDSHSNVYVQDWAIYPLLYRMADKGLIEVLRTERGMGGKQATRTIYRLTERGRKLLRSQGHIWKNAGTLTLQRVG